MLIISEFRQTTFATVILPATFKYEWHTERNLTAVREGSFRNATRAFP